MTLHDLTQALLIGFIMLGGWVFVDMMRDAKNWKDDNNDQ
jgi:hypothetical protein